MNIEKQNRENILENKMEQSKNGSEDNAVVDLMKAMNSLIADEDLTSKFKSPVIPEKYPKFTPTSLIQKMTAIEKSSDVCARDVRFLIKFYLHSTSSSGLSMTSEGFADSQKLMKKYGVDRKAKGDNITVSRIAASFPEVSVKLLREFKIDRKFSTEMLRDKDAADFPWCMRTQMCLSLVPMIPPYMKDPEHHNLIFGIIAYMYYENKVVNRQNDSVRPQILFEKMLNIAHIVYSESNVSVEQKKHAWNHVVFDYIANKSSVDNLLKHFRKEIPDAEAAFKNRFKFFTTVTQNQCTNKQVTLNKNGNSKHRRK